MVPVFEGSVPVTPIEPVLRNAGLRILVCRCS
jgi:hypothetical protein